MSGGFSRADGHRAGYCRHDAPSGRADWLEATRGLAAHRFITAACGSNTASPPGEPAAVALSREQID